MHNRHFVLVHILLNVHVHANIDECNNLLLTVLHERNNFDNIAVFGENLQKVELKGIIH